LTKPRGSSWAAFALALLLCLSAALRADEPYARSRDYDLQNARIHLRFDLAERKVLGEVTHTLAPLRDGLTRLEFDSVNLTIAGVSVGGRPARFSTTSDKLLVQLESPSKASEKLDVHIRYEGRPRRKGLTFVLPDKNYPKRTPHVWTQGEAEETRHYIPIYDYPNDLTASEMIATVPKTWVTLSNGKLVSVKDEPDGTKTWHWRQSQPHAVYLISLVAGEFEEVKETWRHLPLAYYALRGQKERIAPTFERTRKMLDFFTEQIGVPYPWEKYAQIGVEEHFGGMEHTSATTLTHTSLLHPQIAAESLHRSDDLLAHELAHQWFGDLVTCKDWANLWLNEGFAVFFEWLWQEHHYSADDAAYSIWNQRNTWMGSQRLYGVPIVTRNFTDATQYSGNFYGKAGLVLQMLRHELGDADFFKGVRHFLTKHRHQNVVTADLAAAIEEATGRNVDAFLDQWVYRAGAPRFEIGYTYDEAARQVKLEVKQAQKVEGAVGLFRVPVEIEIHMPAGRKIYPIVVSEASQTFTFPADQAPRLVLFDPGNRILKSVKFRKDWQEWVYQLQNAAAVPDRADAARALGEIKDNDEVVDWLGQAAMKDRFWGVRVQAIRALGAIRSPAAQKQIVAAASSAEPWVRYVAVEQMGSFNDDPENGARLERFFREDKSFRVRTTALRAIGQQKTANAFAVLRAAANIDSPDDRIRAAALGAFGPLGDDKAVPMLLDWAAPGKPFPVRSAAIGSLGQLDKKNKELTRRLASFAGEPYQGVRFSALFALSQRNDPEAIAPLEAILQSGELDGFVEQFARDLLERLKKQSTARPAAQ
jgi:aminopeptidase N